jgi:hypothetical protein
MNLTKKGSQSANKSPVKEAFASKIVEKEYIDTSGPFYDDTEGITNKETSLTWGEVYQMFNNHTFPNFLKIILTSTHIEISKGINYIKSQCMQQCFPTRKPFHGS